MHPEACFGNIGPVGLAHHAWRWTVVSLPSLLTLCMEEGEQGRQTATCHPQGEGISSIPPLPCLPAALPLFLACLGWCLGGGGGHSVRRASCWETMPMTLDWQA